MMTVLTTIASTGLRINRSVKPFMRSGVVRFRVQLRRGREGVVDRHGHARAKFEHPGRHDGLAWLHALGDLDEPPLARPVRMSCCRRTLVTWPVLSSFFSSTT